jgi:hypothetical protein
MISRPQHLLAAFACAAFMLGMNAEPLLASQRLIPGFFNPATGQFSLRAPPVAPEAALTTYSGTIVLVFTITIVSAIPTTDQIQCSGGVDASDSSFANNFDEQASVAATRSGTTASCTVKIPYKWMLGSGPTYTPSYTVGTVTTNARSSAYFTLASRPVPASGTTTTLKFEVTL